MLRSESREFPRPDGTIGSDHGAEPAGARDAIAADGDPEVSHAARVPVGAGGRGGQGAEVRPGDRRVQWSA